MPIISLKKINFYYGGTPVLKDVSFDVEEGDYVAVVGPNGAGKTTLIKILLGLEKGALGSARMLGQDLKKFKRWDKIGYLPQETNSFNPLFPATVAEVVSLGLLAQKKYPKKLAKKDWRSVDEILKVFEIFDLKNKLISALSGGQQQRVFLARAMVCEPAILFLDEPSTALDPQARESFFKAVQKINQEKKTTIIIISHDIGQMGAYAGKMLYLDRQVVFYGKFSDFCQSAEMTARFGNYSQHLICHQHGH